MNASVLANIEKWALWLTLMLVPLVILPIFPNPFITGKLVVLVLGVVVALLAKTLRMFLNGNLRLSGGVFDISVIILAAAYIFSTVTKTPNQMEALLFPGTTTLILFSAILYLLINQLDDEDKRKTRYVLILPAVVIAIISFMSVGGIFSSISALPGYIRAASFNLIGGSIPALMYMVAILPMAAMLTLRSKDAATKVLLGVASVLLVMGSVASLYDAYNVGKTNALLPTYKSSWYVTIDSLKESPLAGIGSGNYLTAYNRFRPLTDNQSEFWQARFTTARSFYLTVITETGLIGIAGILFMFITLYALLKRDSKDGKFLSLNMLINDNFVSLVVLLILLALLPSFPAITVLLFALLSLSIKSHRLHLGFMPKADVDGENQEHEKPSNAVRTPFGLLALPILAFVIFTLVNATRLLAAEATYKNALDAVVKNDGRGAYDLLRSAINTNPMVDRYHLTYSQINLALANTVAGKQDLNDQDKQTVSQLVQQSIREGKNAVALNPSRAGNWETLASIYRSISTLAKDADVFAVQTYAQAIALDPGNVNARIALGGMYYAAKNYDAAIDAFKLAVIAKPNHPNARYNLAVALRDKGEINQAITQIEEVITLVERDSEDYKVAMKELEALKAKAPAATPGTGKSLTPPVATTPNPNAPQINLNEEANPPQPVVTPSPTPVATVVPTPNQP
jgi:tetratricopeptide (TPR) repeat protein